MTAARRLTPAGIREARTYLDRLREDPTRPIDPPSHLLFDPAYAQPFDGAPDVHHLRIHTRRDAADYLAALNPQLDAHFVDDWPFWSWMGLFHLEDILYADARRARMSKEGETFVVNPADQLSMRHKFRHYLWSAWRLDVAFGNQVSVLLSRDIMGVERMMRRIVNSPRVFNSYGVAPLIMRLYTSQGRSKRGHSDGPGGLEHLLRVLQQLERTYDVYGMSPDALLRILPPVFREWDTPAP